MGLTAPDSQTAPPQEQEQKPSAGFPQPEPGSRTGSLTIAAGEYRGSRIPLFPGDVLYIGRDASCCHLVLNLAEMPACLCRVQWLPAKDTYLVANYSPNGLRYGSSRPIPVNSSVEVRRGSLFRFGTNNLPVFQVG
ncbi:MAG: FHA domain-containing protein [Clostridiales bacterium]|nr:FHA domain-containing protein [Clostridiales bacterium]